MTTLQALVLSCSLKNSPAESSSELIGRELLAALADHKVDGELVRVADHDVRFGVAVVGVVGNEDGAHHVSAEVFQALNDVGFTIPAGGATYWVGEAMGSTDYNEAGPKPDTTGATTKTAAANAAHLAQLLRDHQYPKA